MDKQRAEMWEKAYDFAYPLVAFQKYVDYITNTEVATETKAPINQFFHTRRVLLPEDHFPAPNMEVIYSQGFLDLKAEPYLITKPATERGFTICINDSYGDCIDVLGKGGTKGDEGKTVYALTGPDFDGELPEGVEQEKIPTNYAYLLVRAKIADIESKEEIAEISMLQDAMDLRPLSSYQRNYVAPKGHYDPAHDVHPMVVLSTQLEIESFFNLYNNLIGDNPGLPEDVEYGKQFLPYHVGPGQVFPLGDYDEEEQAFLRALTKRERGKTPGLYVMNNWEYMPPRYGRYEGDYKLRAYLSFTGFGQNFPEMSSYPSCYLDHDGNQLNGQHKYKMTFPKDGLPPCQDEIGYWGLTLYRKEDYGLIANPINRYSIKDEGQLVVDEDGSITLYLQVDPPEEKYYNNWLPACEGDFLATMRFYYPTKEIIDNHYRLPYIEKYED